MARKVRVKLVKSSIGYSQKQKATLLGLGLKKMNQESVLENTAAVRGMIQKVQHLVRIDIA